MYMYNMDCEKSSTVEYIDDRSASEKYQEIAEQSLDIKQEEEIEHYVEIINEGNGKVTTRLVSASVIAETENATVIPIEQLVNIDLGNLKVLRTQDVQDIVEGQIDISNIDIKADEMKEEHVETMHKKSKIQKAKAIMKGIEDDDVLHQETQYIQVVEKDSVPLVFYSSKPPIIQHTKPKQQKDDSIISIPKELIDSPNFKLFIYPCKQCDFKCNAIKELTAHRLEHHSSGYRQLPMPVRMKQPSKKCLMWDDNSKIMNKKCYICKDYTTSSIALLRRHMYKSHGVSTNFEDDKKSFDHHVKKKSSVHM